jgi:hypothetical protein
MYRYVFLISVVVEGEWSDSFYAPVTFYPPGRFLVLISVRG